MLTNTLGRPSYRFTQVLSQRPVAGCQTQRWASTLNPYPYPTTPRPTPWQIFHLDKGASEKEIKARYYELVRVYHPDSAACRNLSSNERHRRFQTITAAYDALRKPDMHHPAFSYQPMDPFQAELMRRKRAFNRHAEYQRAQAQQPFTTDAYAQAANMKPFSMKTGWKDWMIILAGLCTLAAGLYPGIFISLQQAEQQHLSAVAALRQAREEAREYGTIRRRETRRRVSEQRQIGLSQEEERKWSSESGTDAAGRGGG